MAAKAYLNILSSGRNARSWNIWRTATSLSVFQSFPPHVVQFLLLYQLDMELFEKGRHISFKLWSEKWRSGLNSFDADAHLTQDCLTYGVAVKPSTIKHERASTVCFATQDIGKGDPVGYHYGTILYYRTEVPWNGKVLGEKLMSVTKQNLQNWAICLGQRTKCSHDQTINVWLVPAKLNCMRFINNLRSISSEDDNSWDVLSIYGPCLVLFEETYTLQGDYSSY